MKRRSLVVIGRAALVASAGTLLGCSVYNCLTGQGAAARRPNVIPDTAIRIDPRLAEGERVFMEHCNQCHVGGAAGVGPALVDKKIPEFLIRFQVRHGLGAMPAFSEQRISDGQLEDVLNYLRYLRRHPNGPTA